MNPWLVLSLIVALGIVYVMLPTGLHSFSRYRRTKEVRCPLAGEDVALQIDARRAGISAALSGHPSLRVLDCTLWPGRRECAQDCLRLGESELKEQAA